MTRELLPRHWFSGLIRPEGEDAPFHTLHREMDRLFNEFRHNLGGAWPSMGRENGLFIPTVDETEDDQAFHIKAEMPGVDEKNLDVSLSDGMLNIRGEKNEEKEEKQERLYMRECSYGSFVRSIPIPGSVDESKIKASFKNGVLKIDLPKSEEAKKKAKHIEVKAA